MFTVLEVSNILNENASVSVDVHTCQIIKIFNNKSANLIIKGQRKLINFTFHNFNSLLPKVKCLHKFNFFSYKNSQVEIKTRH